MRISKKVDPAVADLLTRAARTGLSDQQVHERAGLSNGWLSQARGGRYGPGAPSVAQLRRFLDRFEAGAAAPPATSSPPAPPAENVAPSDPAAAAPILVVSAEGTKTPLGRAILEAKTFRELGALTSRIAAATADREIDPKLAAVLNRLVETRAAILKQERAELEAAKVRALEILTEDEVKLLEEHRAKLAGPPLKPGDYPEPPEDVLTKDDDEEDAGPPAPPAPPEAPAA